MLSHQIKARSIARLMLDTTLSEKEIHFFNELENIRKFASDSIELVRNKNYTRIVYLDSSYLLAMLSAADSASFRVKNWCYPFLGCFPLRSYFDIKDAQKEARRLAGNGYEINIEKVDGYSTLGIFSDPVYSFMKDYPLFTLASYIFHEQTHATVYLKDVQFSEELATFIGQEGALKYIQHRVGLDSPQYIDAQNFLKDQKIYLSLIRKLIDELDSLYSLPLERYIKIEKKRMIIDNFKYRLKNDYNNLFSTTYYRGIEKHSFNNAYLAVRRTYTYDLGLFEQLYKKKNNNLKDVVRFAVSLKKQKGDPKEILKKELGL